MEEEVRLWFLCFCSIDGFEIVHFCFDHAASDWKTSSSRAHKLNDQECGMIIDKLNIDRS